MLKTMGMKITIETIPHSAQRYPTVGDWDFVKHLRRPDRITPGPRSAEEPDLVIRVSETGDWRFNAAIAVHELVEVLLCKNDGVSQAAVDAFDIAYEKDREPGDDSEPGDDPAAPYARQHCFATAVERMLIGAFGLSWDAYADAVEALERSEVPPRES